jgi:hypothetical protein
LNSSRILHLSQLLKGTSPTAQMKEGEEINVVTNATAGKDKK